jgi:hypothetical protein
MQRNIAMEALMQGQHAQQVSGRLGSSGRAFASPKQGRKVISFAAKSAFAEVKALCGNFVMDHTASKFQIRICQGTGMSGGGQLLLDMCGKGQTPQHRGWCGVLWRRPERGAARDSVGHGEQHAAGAWFGGIMGAMDSGLNRNEFGQSRGAQVEVMVYMLKIGQDLVQSW